ncbi:PH domain-containing protein [Natrinema salifodinae]|uniref:Membrane protein YdbS, contains bPH2 (Pleckstrin homology) domain n=1 Tax=Natrinema salifodinae TaxID=1202768 RepID=A0A1I0NGN4_9EURY|nr:PH domain-containing protein [Natrinema salifodinae]SEW00331.1 membrane protein YdbS, contains bPH2 (pleckstrin homology) domain [Natrinema salifodinae]
MTRTNPSEDAAESGPEPTGGPVDLRSGDDLAPSKPAWLPRGDDRVRWLDGPRIQTVLPWVALAVVGTAVLLVAIAVDVLPPLAGVGVPVVVAPALWQYARVSRTAFVVTDAVAATRRGVLGVTVRTVSLDRVQNTTVEQDPVGRIVGYGTVTIETAGGADLEFWHVDEPARVRRRLEAERERLAADGENGVPGRREQWEAVLAEVRDVRRALDDGR